LRPPATALVAGARAPAGLPKGFMERGSITKFLLLGLAIFLALTYGRQALFPSKPVLHVWSVQDQTAPPERAAPELCTLQGNQFKAELSTQGGSLRSYVLTNPRFDSLETHQPKNLVSTTAEGRSPLRTDLRVVGKPDDAQAVKYDDLDWRLAAHDEKSCTFTYQDAVTSLKKTISATGRPYELAVDLEVKNLAEQPKTHRLTIEQTAYRHRAEMEGGMMKRQPEEATELVAASDKKTERWSHDDFKPDQLEKEKAEPPAKSKLTSEEWRQALGPGHFAAVSTSYFTNLLEPDTASQGPTPIPPPIAEGQVEAIWDVRFGTSSEGLSKDPNPSYTYRARLAYPEETLPPGATATYRLIAFAGPKDHDLLPALKYDATEVLKLGWSAPLVLVKGLVWYLGRIHSILGSWGWSIVVLTVSVRLLLFPLSLSQIKNSAAMRKLKPEMDAINERYKDDAAQKGLAIQELWRKNGVANPVVGCVPMLLQMPVWFALYSALQTLVELYHVPFGPASGLVPDLVAPGKPFFVIPIILGAASFLQQRIMPPQGDPAQQKMMMYMMPAIFTFMMLFLPAGLGVYMLTNSLLAIGQQLLVERYLKGNAGPAGQIEVKEKPSGGGGKPAPALGKGKARARG
jgi:YidC/Oxa1 family membrane protein insertase